MLRKAVYATCQLSLYDSDPDYRAFLDAQGSAAPDPAARREALARALASARQLGSVPRTYVGWVQDGVLVHDHAPSTLWAWALTLVGGGLLALLALAVLATVVARRERAP